METDLLLIFRVCFLQASRNCCDTGRGGGVHELCFVGWGVVGINALLGKGGGDRHFFVIFVIFVTFFTSRLFVAGGGSVCISCMLVMGVRRTNAHLKALMEGELLFAGPPCVCCVCVCDCVSCIWCVWGLVVVHPLGQVVCVLVVRGGILGLFHLRVEFVFGVYVHTCVLVYRCYNPSPPFCE